jgi:hypothetical protein
MPRHGSNPSVLPCARAPLSPPAHPDRVDRREQCADRGCGRGRHVRVALERHETAPRVGRDRRAERLPVKGGRARAGLGAAACIPHGTGGGGDPDNEHGAVACQPGSAGRARTRRKTARSARCAAMWASRWRAYDAGDRHSHARAANAVAATAAVDATCSRCRALPVASSDVRAVAARPNTWGAARSSAQRSYEAATRPRTARNSASSAAGRSASVSGHSGPAAAPCQPRARAAAVSGGGAAPLLGPGQRSTPCPARATAATRPELQPPTCCCAGLGCPSAAKAARTAAPGGDAAPAAPGPALINGPGSQELRAPA